jgi:acyl carrier protein
VGIARSVDGRHEVEGRATVTREELERAVIDLLAHYCEVDPVTIGSDTRVEEDLGLDSVDAAALLIVLEDRIGEEIDIENLEGISTVGSIVDGLLAMPELASALMEGPLPIAAEGVGGRG